MKDSFMGGDFFKGDSSGKGPAGKGGRWGFYIALAICAAAIGVSAYYTSRERGANPADTLGNSLATSAPEQVYATITPQTARPAASPQSPVKTEKATQPKSVKKPNNNEKRPVSAVAAAIKPSKLTAPAVGQIATPYSPDKLIYSKTYADWRTHSGVDISAPRGAQVKAVADGVVEKVYTDDKLGITIIIDHGGNLKTLYGGLSTDSMVKEGQKVKGGDIISGVGVSPPGESALDPHLHFEITENGKSIDPLKYITISAVPTPEP